MDEEIEIEVCVDCYYFLGTGELPETSNDWHWSDGIENAVFPDGWHPSQIEAIWPAPWYLTADFSREDDEFSACGCDACGLTMAGARYPMIAFKRG